jgi:polyhydroxybutyrate depolymerase
VGLVAATSTAGAAPAVPKAVGTCATTAGLVRRTLVTGGLRRSYLIAVPAGGAATATAPVLLAFHGYSTSAAILATNSGLAAAAGARGVVTVFPDGTGEPTRWALPHRLAGPDDGAFVDALLADLARRGCGDTRRVYAAGFSNGAAFVGELVCRRPGRFRGVAFVGGAGLARSCAAGRVPAEVPVVLVHGAADTVVPLAGGPVLGGALRAEPFRTTVERWRRPGRTVVVRVVPGLGHTWPSLATEEIVATFAA